jgi:hypothetical protein
VNCIKKFFMSMFKKVQESQVMIWASLIPALIKQRQKDL